MVWSVVRILIIAYVCFTLLMCAIQSRLVYFPYKMITCWPNEPFEDVRFEASDGVELAAWFVPAAEPRGVVLLCHGNAGNISHRLETIQFYRDIGMSTFIFDYRGYGQSEGKPTEKGTYLDAEAAWAYLVEVRKIPPGQIVIHGRSLGGAVAARLARDRAPAALIIESSFTSLPDLAAKIYPFLPVRLIARFRYSTKEYVRDAACPVLVVHSPDDEIIPFEHGRRLFDAAGPPKDFLEISGSHNDGWVLSGALYVDGIQQFISEHLGK